MNPVGRIIDIWRYPVSSLGGERLCRAELNATGVVGDRLFALIDAASGVPAAPEKHARWRVALHLQARCVEGNLPTISFPDGSCWPVNDRSLNGMLSDYFGFAVAVAAHEPIDGHPNVRSTEHRHPHYPVHVLTTASLDHLAQLRQVAAIDVRRFPPTVLAKLNDASGFAEKQWVGHGLRLGAVELRAVEETTRCGMTFIAQPDVEEDPETLGDRVLTNQTIFELSDLPRSVAVIGAGPLGLELAQALARLGVATKVFDEGSRIAGLHDDDVAKELKEILEKEMPIHLGVSLSLERAGDEARISWKGASTGEDRFERVLVATGRPPDLSGLDLKTTGIALDDRGTPKTDPGTMQCGNAPIFMCGDADAQRPVLHEASSEGAIAGRNAATYPTVRRSRRNVAFSIMFTDPPLALIGPPVTKDAVIGSSSYSDQGRAKVDGRNAGLVRLYAERPEGKLVGAAMLGPGMDHIGHLLAWATERGETATEILRHPFYHPTFEEGLKTALREICKSVEAPTSPEQDDGHMPGA